MIQNMIKRKVRAEKKVAAILILFVIAAVACGASGKRKSEQSQAPLKPLTYDPQISLAPLVEKVGPAVVNIKTATKIRSQFSMHGGPDSLFEFFFGPKGPGMRPNRQMPDQVQRSMGSGFIIDKTGLVVTNHHVVAHADDIDVQLADDRTFKATLVGSDERTDVALLKLEKASNLPVVKFGDSSKLKVGDRVVAIGNPFGLDHTVTSGIVSAKERVIGAGPYDDFIQTDASINPGNSGGPLFNLAGEVIGINTAIARTGQGIGFAIPSDLAKGLIDSLRENGQVIRGWLGIAFQPLDDQLAGALGLSNKEGALVANVNEGSPAQKGGMKAGDVIVTAAGKHLKGAHDLPTIVAGLGPGKTYPFVVIRDGQKKTLKVKIGTMPSDGTSGTVSSDSGDKTNLGFNVAPLDDRTRSQLRADPVRGGVVVTHVDSSSTAASVLQTGDIVIEVNRTYVNSVDEFNNAVKGLKSGDDLLIKIFRRGAWIYKVIRL